MTTVDSLDIQISAQASKASSSLDNLVSKLNTLSTSLSRINGSGLTGLANGVNKLSTAMQGMKTVGTADFTRLAKNIEKLGNINTANLNSAASSMSQLTRAFNQLGGVSANAQQVGVLASNLSKLGYKSINNAIANLPALTSGLNNLMTTLSKAPAVSNNVIQMTNAIANLASQGSRVGTASNTLVNGLNRSTSAMNRATKSSKSLAAAFGKFYATWFLVIRGVKKLWSSVESSMDYIEVLNYFDAAFTQVAEKADLSSWQELGYASAEEYANSFAERAKELTSKMTGFEISPTGTLEAKGIPSLGLDPSQLMTYQAMFGQMASSMGVASETAVKLSDALSMIGADLASVKNLDFEDVWEDMASGLAGMSRTLDKYGVNIRNVNLQQKLTELGIDANITALNQNDKALLRTIILLDSTRYAWGDLADTINQPANQLRLITANFQNLARTIGNLFLPIVQKVLPYINALVIALQRLFTWIGNLLGIDLSGITSSIGSTDFSDLIEDTDDLTDGLNDAAKAADKLKKGIRGFDELNVITTQDASDSGTSAGTGLTSGLLDAAFEDALSEYQKVWDEAFANMENRAQELADRIEKLFQPIKDIIEDFAVGDFFKAGQDVSSLVVSITDFFARAIDKVDWYGIGQKIGDFLAGINWIEVLNSFGRLFWKGINGAVESWKGSFNAKPIETAIFSILALPALVGFGSKIISFIVTPFENVFNLLSPIIGSIGGLFAEGGVFGSGGIIATASAPVLVLTAAFASLASGLGYVFATNEEVRQSFKNAVNSIKEGLQPAIEFLTEQLLPDLQSGWNRILEILTPLGEFLEGAFTSIWQDMINPALKYIGETVLPKVSEAFENLWNNVLVPFGSFLADVLEPVIQIVSDVLTVLWENIVVPLADAIGNVLSKAFEGICDIFNETVIPIVSTVIETFQFLWDNVLYPIVDFLQDTFKPVFQEVFESIGKIIGDIKDIFSGLIEFVTGIFTGDWEEAWNGIVEVFENIFNTITDIAESVINGAIGIINGVIRGINKVASFIGAKEIPEIGSLETRSKKGEFKIGGKTNLQNAVNELTKIAEIQNEATKELKETIKEFPTKNVPNINLEIDLNKMNSKIKMQKFETGGFPEDGLFYANHGELVGQFANGKTAVANNEQITKGIADAVYPAVYNAVSAAMKNAGNSTSVPDVQVFVGGNEVTDVVIKGINERTNRTGKTPLKLAF